MKQTVLFEIGVEELPARFIPAAEKQLAEKTTEWFTATRIPYEHIQTFSTPRRLSVRIEGVSHTQTTIREEVRGPALQIAKKDDEWTKAALGFTKGQGKTVEDVYTKDVKNTTYIFVEKVTEGQYTKDLLPSFKDVITSLTFPQQMKWGKESFAFARPIRWIAALCDENVIPFSIAGVQTSNQTKGHRFLGEDCIISDPMEYEQLLQKNYVLVDPKEREQKILKEIHSLEQKHGYDVIIEDSLLSEVVHLVEFPTVFAGTYEEAFLTLPSEVLKTSMQEHQRYFPVEKQKQLIPCFIGVRNGNENYLSNVVAGNEKVLHARLSDGEFFYAEDQKRSIAHYNERLQSIVFQEKLGTVSDKVTRVEKIAEKLAIELGLNDELLKDLRRTASICKFDLPTLMVNEFPELQGVMGEKYARLANEKKEIAVAIREHYKPLHARGELPTTDLGSIVSVADKLDTIVGCISVGLMPTGSKDPYGLRRQTIGVLRIIHEHKWELPVETLIQIVQETLTEQGITITAESAQLINFIRMRAAYVMRELGIEQDIIQSVISQDIGVFSYRFEKAKELFNMRNNESYKKVQEAFVRVLNLQKQAKEGTIRTDLFETETERSLYKHLLETKEGFAQADQRFDAQLALQTLARLAHPIEEFFEHNMVMADDETVRTNRLSLLFELATLIRTYAHIDEIEWKQTF